MDLYERWLEISPGARPPDHYCLLGLVRFEAAVEVIRRAARDRMRKVRPLSLKYPEDATRLLNEIATAQVCLLDPECKVEYDRTLAAVTQSQAEGQPARTVFYVGIDLGS